MPELYLNQLPSRQWTRALSSAIELIFCYDARPYKSSRLPSIETSLPSYYIPVNIHSISNHSTATSSHLIMKGQVKYWDSEKGEGYITPDGGGFDLYVPLSAIQVRLVYCSSSRVDFGD